MPRYDKEHISVVKHNMLALTIISQLRRRSILESKTGLTNIWESWWNCPLKTEYHALSTFISTFFSLQAKTKMRLPFAYPTCAMFEACLDDGELFYATEIVALSVSTTRYPTARLLHLMLSRILLVKYATFCQTTFPHPTGKTCNILSNYISTSSWWNMQHFVKLHFHILLVKHTTFCQTTFPHPPGETHNILSNYISTSYWWNT